MAESGLFPAVPPDSGVSGASGRASAWRRYEGPTWTVAIAVYGGWFLLTWNAAALPWWTVLPLGAFLTAWHGSLQHEIMHGHPTSYGSVNAILATPPLALWIPFPIYRDSHLDHHLTPELTCPQGDTESFYVEAARWQRMGAPMRALLIYNNTLLGRLTVGPAIVQVRFWHDEVRRIAGGDRRYGGVWLGHGAGVAVVLAWLSVCGIPLLHYIALFVYPGLSLTLLRSFLEHRPAPNQAHRTAIVEADPVTRLLFLNLNFHALHHDRPGHPWYLLPALYAADGGAIVAANGGFFHSGYGAIARRFFLKPKDHPVHPG